MATGSLAARCPACSTVFRVVPDQLRVSEGWVRCGRCAEVFNAAESLIDLETGAPRRRIGEAPVILRTGLAPSADPYQPAEAEPGHVGWNTPAAFEPPVDPAPARSDPVFEPAVEVEDEPDFENGPEAESPSVPALDAGIDSRQITEQTPAADQPDLPFDEPAQVRAPQGQAEAAARADTRADAEPDAAESLPSFVRQADRAARWRQPRVRAALASAALLSVLGLLSQVGVEYRDLVAARWPGSRAALVQACGWFGCTVGPARVIDGLAVESSGLVRVAQSNVYRLSVVLRNRAGIELALPALDLSLTDTQGRLIARRVLRMAELGATQSTLPAGRELGLQATLQAQAAPSTPAAPADAGDAVTGGAEVVAGYTIDLFYP